MAHTLLREGSPKESQLRGEERKRRKKEEEGEERRGGTFTIDLYSLFCE
jgi:hypothetical protein